MPSTDYVGQQEMMRQFKLQPVVLAAAELRSVY